MGKKRNHRRLPPIELLEQKFDYDPLTGGLYKKGAEPCEDNCIGSFTATGHKQVWVKGHGAYLVHRIVFYMYHRTDPLSYIVDHINGDPADNRIKNLRRCRPRANALNQRKKGKYVVDSDGVGLWVSGTVKL